MKKGIDALRLVKAPHPRADARLGLNAAQARNWPSCDSTRTVSPLSPPPLAMAIQNPGMAAQQRALFAGA
jgi:hypothetical protein